MKIPEPQIKSQFVYRLPKEICLGVILLVLISFSVINREALADTNSHRLAALRLAEVLGVEAQIEGTRQRIFESELRRDPDTKNYKLVIASFYQQFLCYAVLKQRILDLLVTELTEDELILASQFYGSPAGKKIAAALPLLSMKINRLVFEQGRQRIPELKKMIREEEASVSPDVNLDQEGSEAP